MYIFTVFSKHVKSIVGGKKKLKEGERKASLCSLLWLLEGLVWRAHAWAGLLLVGEHALAGGERRRQAAEGVEPEGAQRSCLESAPSCLLGRPGGKERKTETEICYLKKLYISLKQLILYPGHHNHSFSREHSLSVLKLIIYRGLVFRNILYACA